MYRSSGSITMQYTSSKNFLVVSSWKFSRVIILTLSGSGVHRSTLNINWFGCKACAAAVEFVVGFEVLLGFALKKSRMASTWNVSKRRVAASLYKDYERYRRHRRYAPNLCTCGNCTRKSGPIRSTHFSKFGCRENNKSCTDWPYSSYRDFSTPRISSGARNPTIGSNVHSFASSKVIITLSFSEIKSELSQTRFEFIRSQYYSQRCAFFASRLSFFTWIQAITTTTRTTRTSHRDSRLDRSSFERFAKKEVVLYSWESDSSFQKEPRREVSWLRLYGDPLHRIERLRRRIAWRNMGMRLARVSWTGLLSNEGNACGVLDWIEDCPSLRGRECSGIHSRSGYSLMWSVVYEDEWIAALLVLRMSSVLSFTSLCPLCRVAIASRDLPCDSSSSRFLLRKARRLPSCARSGEHANQRVEACVHSRDGLQRATVLRSSLRSLRHCNRIRADAWRLCSLGTRLRSSCVGSYLAGTSDAAAATTSRRAADP